MLDKIDRQAQRDPGAISSAFSGRGEKMGKTVTDFEAPLLAKLEPSLPNLSHDIESMGCGVERLRDAAPDLLSTVEEDQQD